MQIKQVEKDGILICYLTGEVDIDTSPEIKKIFDKAINAKKPKILLNLKDVTYIDSSGLATMVEILKGLRTYGGKLKLSNLSVKIKSLFEITKLDKLFDISPGEQEAVETF